MFKQQKSIKYVIIILCLIGGTINALQTNAQDQTTDQIRSKNISEDNFGPLVYTHPSFSYSYSPHDPIEINDDTDFTSANGVTSGSGTEEKPYIIGHWNITASGNHGIFINGTTKHFIIRNNFIDNGTSEGNQGIYLYKIASGTAKLENNVCQNNAIGISLFLSSDNSLINNLCTNNIIGVYINRSSYNFLANNNISNNQGGIEMDFSHNNALINNTFGSNRYTGIVLIGSSFNLISWNYIIDNNNGIYLYYSYYSPFPKAISSDNNLIHHNSFIAYGVFSYHGSRHASDYGNDNIWYDKESNEGNYWDDRDVEEDGYSIPSPHPRSIDPYPLQVPPVLTTPVEKPKWNTTSDASFSHIFIVMTILSVLVSTNYVKRKK
ncbi:MAG: right-handed parallel beta-helix repeat-containing protein [Candidatus Heimdallarchaeota archaeon]|nr:right-handed parallel beta-helix repeat-containing protein [Candidatus Heimdallarchaeota archaeon]MCK5048400.1 right-handed parallel beta-helix repeat-containing protein [Candidatus Heimdallarchaeota archaeon]